MSVLRVENLTVAFGGITAVSDLDLTVERGQIFSVIGPNGAGKTTVFNVVSGVYAPTRGRVLVGGTTAERPLTRTAVAGIAGVGLLVAVLALFAAAGVEEFWSAAVRRPFADPGARFDLGTSLSAARDYLLGKPGVTKVPFEDRWRVTSLDGRTVYGTAPSEAEARELRDALLAGPTGLEIDKAGGRLRTARVTAGRFTLAEFDSVEQALKAFPALAGAPAARSAHRTAQLVSALAGLALGTAGAAVVWRRGRRTPEAVAARGVARTFQNVRLFRDMTALENVLVGLDRTLSRNVLAMALRLPRHRREEAAARAKADELLAFVGLAGRGGQLARNLPYGDQRRLEVARALATGPTLLLLDEPAAGMNPSEAARLTDLIRQIRDRGVTVLLIEHHMAVVMGISDRVAVLDHGVKIAEGPPAEVGRDPRVIEAYLGREGAH